MKLVLLNQIISNLNTIDDKDYLVLKSDAYGFGLSEILKLISKTNLSKFCVINLDDALLIRKYIKNARILLIVPLNRDFLSIYEDYNIELSVGSNDDFEVIKKLNIKYQIKINSGMNRFGLKKIKEEMLLNTNLTGIYSHNATNDYILIKNQLSYFSEIKYRENIDVHYFSSSVTTMNFGNCRRYGQKIYDNALVVKAKVIAYQFLEKGDFLGYDYSYCAEENQIIGVLDIGYADGLFRNCDGFMVSVDNGYAKLVAKSCMNHSFVLLPSENIKEVEIIGKKNTIEKYEKYFNLTKHEIYISYSLSTNHYIL